MKSKEEILKNYYSQGADGMPEISAEGLLKAMEEYRQQAEEAAFSAAREYSNDTPGGTYSYQTFADYKASLIVPVSTPEEPTEAASIQLMADSILEMFIPHDKSEKNISFDIRSARKSYTVSYTQNDGRWMFTGYVNTDS